MTADESAATAVAELHVVPLAGCPRPLLDALVAGLSHRVRVPCRLVELGLERHEPRLAGRDQLDARALLAGLEQATGAAAQAVRLGLTTRDVGLAVFSFVFGLACTDGCGAAVVSLARLDPRFYGLPADAVVTARRALGETLHELGHVARLRHCAAPDCVMWFAGDVEKADARGAAFCDACRARLPAWLRPADAPA